MRLEVTLTHPAAAFAAMLALESMSEEPVHAQHTLISVSVPERSGAVMEAAQRLIRAGVAADDIEVRPDPVQRLGLAV